MTIPLPRAIRLCLDTLVQGGHSAYVVGGCVRDTLLGKTPADWDVCTSALPEQVTHLFSHYKVIPTGLQHGTVTALIGDKSIEITTCRNDGVYMDHRRPQSVTFSRDVREDLARRDFTVNAMAYHPAQGLVDPFGGRADLGRRVLRCVGQPAERFEEDALRILRLFRFAARLGFSPEEGALNAAREKAPLLERVSAERVASELSGLLVGEGVFSALCLAADGGVLGVILPELAPCMGFDQHKPHHPHTLDRHLFAAVAAAPKDLELRLAMLLHDVGKPDVFVLDAQGRGHCPGHAVVSAAWAAVILKRLRYPTALCRRVEQLVASHSRKLPGEKAALRRLCGELGIDVVRQLSWVKEADNRAKDESKAREAAKYARIRELLDEMEEAGEPVEISQLAVSGNDLLALGIPYGPAIGKVLQALLALAWDNPGCNTRERLLEAAARIWRRGEGS